MAEDSVVQSPSSLPIIHKVPCLLFCLQLLLSTCSTAWSFTSSLLIYQMNPGSLTLPAIQGVVGMVSTVVTAPYLGAWIDLTPRLTVATILCIVQSIAVSLSSILLSVYLSSEDYIKKIEGCDESGCWIENLALFFIIGLAVVASVMSGAMAIVIQKDWVVVLFDRDKKKLAVVNFWIRAVELGSRMVIPAVAGVGMSQMSYSTVGIIQGVLFLVVGMLEVFVIRWIYNLSESLAVFKGKEKSTNNQIESIREKLVHLGTGFKLFFKHKVCLPGISLAMLYLTVLAFDSITIGFCKASGVTEYILGILYGVSSGSGLLGSLCFPFLRSKLGLNYTAFIGVSVLVLSDVLCVISIFLPQSQFMKPEQPSPDEDSLSVVYLLIVGVIVARFGLHMFDLCIIQLFQEEVPETKRGIISGVESFLCNSMDMIKFALVILLPSPQLHFGYLVVISFTSVFLGWCIFVIFIYLQRRPEKSEVTTATNLDKIPEHNEAYFE